MRATWRVLLAMPLLWVFTGAVLTGNVQSAIAAIPSGGETGSGLAQSVLHATFVVLVLAVWARYLDRRPLSSYGISANPAWALQFLGGVAAVLVGSVCWGALGVALGYTTVAVSPSVPEGSLLVGVVVPFVALVLHAAVQQVVFFCVILEAAAEGLASRKLAARRAAIAAIPVAVCFFVLMHGSTTPLRIFDLVVAGSVFALLYLHTGSLALGIGVHFGGLYVGIGLAALVRTTGSLPGVLGTVSQYGFPTVLIAYALLVGWLYWRHRELGIRREVARRTGT